MSFIARILWSVALPPLVAGFLTIHPKDTEAKSYHSTYLNCSTSNSTQPIHWHHGNEYVYTGNGIMERYGGRFEMEINSFTGAYNLVIRSVRPEDAGEYTCIDGGIGESRIAQLIVIDDDPSCYLIRKQEVVTKSDTYGKESEDVQLGCLVSYRGSDPPVLEWHSVGGNRAALPGQSFIINADGRATYALLVKPSVEIQAKPFICQTTRSAKKPYTCRVNRILSSESSSAKALRTFSLLGLMAVGYVQRSFCI